MEVFSHAQLSTLFACLPGWEGRGSRHRMLEEPLFDAIALHLWLGPLGFWVG